MDVRTRPRWPVVRLPLLGMAHALAFSASWNACKLVRVGRVVAVAILGISDVGIGNVDEMSLVEKSTELMGVKVWSTWAERRGAVAA